MKLFGLVHLFLALLFRSGKGLFSPPLLDLESRLALVEVAQRAVKSDPVWKQKFQNMQKRMHRN
jgi:hypothetical protein